MQITLSPELEVKLFEEAARRGLDPAGYVESLVIDQLSFVAANRASIELIRKWQREGTVAADPDEVRRARAEAQQFFRELALDRGYTAAAAEEFATATVGNS